MSVGKRKGRGAKSVGPSHREQGNREQGKGFGAKTITYGTAGEAAEEGEGDQDPGSKPGRRSREMAGPLESRPSTGPTPKAYLQNPLWGAPRSGRRPLQGSASAPATQD